MAVRALSETEFSEIMPNAAKRFPKAYVVVHAWFATEDNKYLGTVTRDTDSDACWGLSILKKKPDGTYGIVDGDLDVKDKDDGIVKLKKALEEREAKPSKKKGS
jgi:hypothetical protein